MIRILVVYGTTDGHTSKVALRLGMELRHAGADADVLMASRAAPGPEGYDAVIVAASLQAGKYQKPVRNWLRKYARELRGKTSAFVSVCMMVRDPREETQLKLRNIMFDFADSCGWMPGDLKPVAGALAYTRYHWFKRWAVKQMAARTGGDTDTSRDHEYTDWADLAAFAAGFAARVERRRDLNLRTVSSQVA